MRITLAQINAVIGDFEGNRKKILDAVERSRSAGCATNAGTGAGTDPVAGSSSGMFGAAVAGVVSGLPAYGQSGDLDPDLVVVPELSLCGYPPLDLLDQECFASECLASLRLLQKALPPGIAVAVGHVDRNRSGSGRSLFNSMSVILDGKIVFSQAKTLLPTYDVFDEARYFEPAARRAVFRHGGMNIGFAICEDIWWESPPSKDFHYALDPVKELFDAGADILIVPSASPFVSGKMETRLGLAAKAARAGSVPVLYCNMCGADDSLVFDGRSFATDACGNLAKMAGWGEDILSVDTDVLALSTVMQKRFKDSGLPPESAVNNSGQSGSVPSVHVPGMRPAGSPEGSPANPDFDPVMEDVGEALVIGIRDYMKKCGFTRACLGLSGGIDSALVAVLAALAIGPENVTCISMPSRFSSEGSVSDSEALCRIVGIRLETLPIEGPFMAYLDLLSTPFAGTAPGLAEENLQARIRGALLMAWSNKFGDMLLTTGNKSEIAVGYCTLYGDMCGALAPIGDLFKTEVYALSRHLNAKLAPRHGGQKVIPESTLTKAPSAELRYNQTDQDSLPPYDLLDAVLELHIERELSCSGIVMKGYDKALVERIILMTARAEYKRRQAAPVIKVSRRAFGLGRRMPIARVVHEIRS